MKWIVRWIKGFFGSNSTDKNKTEKFKIDKIYNFVETDGDIDFEKRSRFYVPPSLRRY